MLCGEAFGLGQSFTRDDGDFYGRALAGPVEHQILDRVGGAAFQRGGDLAALVVAAGTGGVHLGVKDLAVRQDQLAGHAHGRQPKRGLAQRIQRLRQIGGVEGYIPDGQPALRGSVQQRDGIARKV